MSVLDYVKRTPIDGTTRRPAFRIARPEYYVQTGSMFENPHGVPHEEIVRMILDNPAEVVAQVVFGKYVESDGLVFTAELVQQLFDRSGRFYGTGAFDRWDQDGRDFRILANTWLYEPAVRIAQQLKRWRGMSDARMPNFATGVDFARQTDYTVIFTLDTRQRPAKVVYYKRLNRVPWDTIYAEVGRAVYLFGSNVLCDGTGPGGDVSMDRIQSSVYCPVHHRINNSGEFCMRGEERMDDCTAEDYVSMSGVDSYAFTGPSKKELVEHLRNVLAHGYYPGIAEPFGWLRCPPIPQLEEELTFYAWDDKRLVTDSIFALALAAWAGLEDVPAAPLFGSPMGG